MGNDNKRERPSQGLIDYLGGMYEKKEEENMWSFSYEPIYKNETKKLNIPVGGGFRTTYFKFRNNVKEKNKTSRTD